MVGQTDKRTSGEPLSIRAAAWNSMIDETVAAKAKRVEKGETQLPRSENPASTIIIRNDTGSAISVGDALAIGAPIFLPSAALDTFKTRTAFVGDTPTASDYGNVAIAVEPIDDGKLGIVAVAGVVAAQVEFDNDFIERVDLKENATTLEQKPNGTGIVLWRQSGAGTKWATVLLGQRNNVTYVGEADGAIAANSTGVVDLYDGATNVTSVMASLDRLHGNEGISSEKEVFVTWFAAERLWRITGAECE